MAWAFVTVGLTDVLLVRLTAARGQWAVVLQGILEPGPPLSMDVSASARQSLRRSLSSSRSSMDPERSSVARESVDESVGGSASRSTRNAESA